MRHLGARAAAYGTAAVLGICAVAFLAFAGYLQLEKTMAPAAAALMTGGVLLALASLVVLFSRRAGVRRGRRGGRRRPDSDPVDGLEAMLDERVDPVLSRWLRRYPERAAVATLLLGVGAGYSRSVRRVLQDVYNQYVETEKERRARDRDRD